MQVQEWLEFLNSESGEMSDDKLQKVCLTLHHICPNLIRPAYLCIITLHAVLVANEHWCTYSQRGGCFFQVDEHLRTRNYLAGHAITVADFAAFAAAHPAVSAFSEQQVQQHVNLVRW